MMRLLVAAGALLLAAPVRADEHLELLAAQAELRLARRYLQLAGRHFEGHRHAALDEVNAALKDIREALDEVKREEHGPGSGGADD